MTEGDIYESTEQYARQNAIGYVHFRNVKDKVPHYKETFIDEGEIDSSQFFRLLVKYFPDATTGYQQKKTRVESEVLTNSEERQDG